MSQQHLLLDDLLLCILLLHMTQIQIPPRQLNSIMPRLTVIENSEIDIRLFLVESSREEAGVDELFVDREALSLSLFEEHGGVVKLRGIDSAVMIWRNCVH